MAADANNTGSLLWMPITAVQFEYSDAYLDKLADNWTRVSYPIISRFLNVELARRPQATALDLGCGNGAYGVLLKKHCAELSGIDVAEEAVARCGASGVYAKAVCGSGTALPFPDQRFDLVFSTEVIEHIEDTTAVFAEISRVLKRGGRFVFTTTLYFPSIWSYWTMSQAQGHTMGRRLHEVTRFLRGYFDPQVQQQFVREWCFELQGGHYHGFHVDHLKDCLAHTGFQVIQVNKFHAVDPIPVLEAGNLSAWLKKGTLRSYLLSPLVIPVAFMNHVLRLSGYCANNVFIVAEKGS